MSLERSSDLADEGRVLMAYLAAGPVAPELVDRYQAANQALLAGEPTDAERAVLDFAVGRRWALPLLDGATALLRPQSVLRQKLFVAAGILEASTHHVELFVPGYTAPVAMMVKVGVWGLKAAVKALFGIPLLVAIRWRSG